jgi:hypothetical protein
MELWIMKILTVKNISSLFLSILIVCIVSSCQKIPRDVAGSAAPEDAPEYTVEFDPNNSPASSK